VAAERPHAAGDGEGGVERAFAVQAGRDVRVMVSPSLVDDAQAAALAREIAQEISEELTFPGQIRVTVVRESRAVEIAISIWKWMACPPGSAPLSWQ